MNIELHSGMSEQDLYRCFGINPHDKKSDLPFGECPECSNNTLVYEQHYCTSCDAEIDIEAWQQANYQQHLTEKDD